MCENIKAGADDLGSDTNITLAREAGDISISIARFTGQTTNPTIPMVTLRLLWAIFLPPASRVPFRNSFS